MYIFKGFVTNKALINNAAGQTALFGELSTLSQTYAREKGLYNSSVSTSLSLVSFTNVVNGEVASVSQELVDHIITISKAVYDYAANEGGEIFADELKSHLLNTNAAGSAYNCGQIINNGALWVPEWISWTATNVGDEATTDIKIWLSDSAFQNQYDGYEIVVVPPTDTLNTFFGTAVQVTAMLSAYTDSQKMSRIQAAQGGYPYTIIRSETFEWVNPLNNADKKKATWTTLIYGRAGDHLDAVKDAIIAHTLANSTHVESEWKTLIPDLFRRTEFIMIPLWDQYAIPERTVQAGIYSPQANLKRVTALVKTIASSYSPTHVDDYLSLMSHPYKSLQIATIGGPDNRDSKYELIDEFPDIVCVGTGSNDFARMSQNTKTWLMSFANLLLAAETMTEYSARPTGINRVKRGDLVYASISYNNIHYLVLAKSNMTTVISGE